MMVAKGTSKTIVLRMKKLMPIGGSEEAAVDAHQNQARQQLCCRIPRRR
jgi:hypothetical protein